MAIETIKHKDADDADYFVAVDSVNDGGTNKAFQVMKLGVGADGELPALIDAGQQAMAGSVPVVIASDQSAFPVTVSGVATQTTLAALNTVAGTTADAEALTGNGTWVALLKAARTLLTAIRDRLPAALTSGHLSVTLGQPLDATNDEVRVTTAIPANMVSGTSGADITDTTNHAIIAAQGAGVRIYLDSLSVSNAHATVGTWVQIKSASTVIHEVWCGPLGGGESKTFRTPLRLGANEALNAAAITTGAAVRVSAAGYKSST